MKTILLDGDILVYQIGFSVETPIYVCGGRIYKSRNKCETRSKELGLEIHKRKNRGSWEQVKLNLKMKLKMIFDDLGTTNYKMYLTASGLENNFRSKISTYMPYKANRTAERPFYYKELRKLLVEKYNAIVITGQEADDAIGIEQYRIRNEQGTFETSYVATIDKDLRILEGWHYHLNTRELKYVNAEDGLKNFYGQLLKGDATDNIPGLTKLLKLKGREEEANKLSYGKPGYLKQYAEFELEHSPQECLDYVVNMYKKYGFGDIEINEIGSLLWIRRNEGELWSL